MKNTIFFILIFVLSFLIITPKLEAEKKKKVIEEIFKILENKIEVSEIIFKYKDIYPDFKKLDKLLNNDFSNRYKNVKSDTDIDLIIDDSVSIIIKAMKKIFTIIDENYDKNPQDINNVINYLKTIEIHNDLNKLLFDYEDTKLATINEYGFKICYDFLRNSNNSTEDKVKLLKWYVLFSIVGLQNETEKDKDKGLKRAYSVAEYYSENFEDIDTVEKGLKEINLPLKKELPIELYHKAELYKIQGDILVLLKSKKLAIEKYIKSFYYELFSRHDKKVLNEIVDVLKQLNPPEKIINKLNDKIKIFTGKTEDIESIIKFYSNPPKNFKMSSSDYITLCLAYLRFNGAKNMEKINKLITKIDEKDFGNNIYERELYNFIAGYCYYKKEENKKAKEYFSNCKIYIFSKLLLTEILFSEKNFDEAEKEIKEIIELYPSYKNNRTIIKMSIIINGLNRNYKNIIELYERENAKKIFDEHPLFLFQVFVAFGEIRNENGLTEILAKMMKLYPDSKELKIIEDALETEDKKVYKEFQDIKNSLKEIDLKGFDINEFIEYYFESKKDKEQNKIEKETQDKQKIETESEN